MVLLSKEVKGEILERIENILNSNTEYSRVEFETIINKIVIDIEKRQKNTRVADSKIDKKTKPLSSYNLFIKEQIPILKGTSIERFRCASQLWKEQKDKK
jgi:hypothetical protein